MQQIKQVGFTLMELMITVAIIAILASIAYPAYQDSVTRARRADAKAALLSLQQAQEKFRANCIEYADNIVSAGNRECDTDTDTYSLEFSSTSPDDFYNLSISAANSTSYTITATAKGAQAGDSECKIFSIDQDGNKSSKDGDNNVNDTSENDNCWKK